MISPEILINALQTENNRLKEELEQAQKDIHDFEVLAIEWKKGYSDLERAHKRQIMEYRQIIQELQDELWQKP
jgi:predicted RNase H-like nuclease (RuvC/YqgF family)